MNNRIKKVITFIRSNLVVSLLITIIGVISSTIGIMTYYEQTEYTRQNVKEELIQLYSKKLWFEFEDKLEKIRYKEHLTDLYYYFKGLMFIENPTPNEDPSYYLSRVEGDSEHYLDAQIWLVDFAYQKYGPDQIDSFRIEIGKIADHMKSGGNKIPYYYLMKLASMFDKKYHEVKVLLDDFKVTFAQFIDPSTLQLRKKMQVKPGQRVAIHHIVHLPPIVYYFQFHLAFAAHNECLKDKKMNAIDKIKNIFQENNESGMKVLFRQFSAARLFFKPSINILHKIKSMEANCQFH